MNFEIRTERVGGLIRWRDVPRDYDPPFTFAAAHMPLLRAHVLAAAAAECYWAAATTRWGLEPRPLAARSNLFPAILEVADSLYDSPIEIPRYCGTDEGGCKLAAVRLFDEFCTGPVPILNIALAARHVEILAWLAHQAPIDPDHETARTFRLAASGAGPGAT